MFFEINNTIQDSEKLSRKRLLIKKYIQKRIEEEPTITKINQETYYCEESMQIIQLKNQDIEKYTKTNFSF